MAKRTKTKKFCNPVHVKCEGEAHSNAFIDYCGRCMPNWGYITVEADSDEGKAAIAEGRTVTP